MADGYSAEDPMVICPLDKSHQIRKSRLIFHLVRCKKNHDMSKKATCLFNSSHIVDKNELQDHHTTCLDRREIRQIEYESDEENDARWEGILSLQDVVKAHNQSSTSGENWDNAPEVGTYDPFKAAENKPLIRPLIVASKSAKKAWKKSERLKMAQFDQSPKYSEVKTAKEVQVKTSPEPLRPPKPNMTTVSTKENGKFVDQVKTKTQNAPTVADQLVTNLKLLNISDEAKNLDTNDFPALQPPKSFSSALKARKPSGKQ